MNFINSTSWWGRKSGNVRLLFSSVLSLLRQTCVAAVGDKWSIHLFAVSHTSFVCWCWRRSWKLLWPSVCSPLGLMAVLATCELMGNWLRWCFPLNATWFFCGRLHGWELVLLLRLVIELHLCHTASEPWWGNYVFPQIVIGEYDSEGLLLPRSMVCLFLCESDIHVTASFIFSVQFPDIPTKHIKFSYSVHFTWSLTISCP